MATGGIDYSMLLETSILCSKEYITDEHITLPHDKDGKTDYSTLGNILVAKLLEENLYISYVDKEHGHSDKASLMPDLEGWKYFTKEKEVKIFRKCYANFPLHAFAGRIVIDVPLQKIAKVISDLKNRFHYDPLLQEAKDTVTLSPEDYISYMRHEAKRCLFTAKRDFCFYARRAFKEGKYIQAIMSMEHPSCPLVEGVVRAKFHPGTGWVLEPYRGDPTRTLVTLICHIDLCGMPNLIINRVIRREPVGLAYLKKHMMSLDSPTIAVPALRSITLNFDASLSSSTHHESQSLPTTPTSVYMKSPDLLMNKSNKKTDTTNSDELFSSAPQELESKPQSVSHSSSEQNTSNNLQVNTNNSCDKVEEQTDQVQQQDDGPQLPMKSKKYIKNLTMAANQSAFDGSSNNNGMTVPTTSGQNVTFTLSAGSDISSVGSDRVRGTISNTASTEALEQSKKSVAASSESAEVPQLSSGQFDIFVSL